tara:strand:+ start:2210 stop:3196 length:987 start_codon:yes stop_codon:yes gene_type:complete
MNSTKSIPFSKKDSKKLNAIGLRATYGLTILKLKEEIKSLAVFTADTSTSAGLDRFRQTYPESFYDIGIAEQAMISIAAGYVAEGGIAAASTFAPFLMLRSAEQIRLSLGYMNLPLIVTGLASGLALGHLGYTHCCVEDSSLAISIPNIYMYTPSDAFELRNFLPYIINMRRPTYIRLTGIGKTKQIYSDDITTDFYSPIPIETSGEELLILSSGVVSANVKEAINLLVEARKEKISHYVIPFLDQVKTPEAIGRIIKNFPNIIVCDESTIGGVSSIILSQLQNLKITPNLILNIHPSKYLSCGSHDYMLKQIGLSKEEIYEQIIKII